MKLYAPLRAQQSQRGIGDRLLRERIAHRGGYLRLHAQIVTLLEAAVSDANAILAGRTGSRRAAAACPRADRLIAPIEISAITATSINRSEMMRRVMIMMRSFGLWQLVAFRIASGGAHRIGRHSLY